MMESVKVLSVKQPWATLIFLGKDIENRTWLTNYRGKLYIHASAKWDTRSKDIRQLLTVEQRNSLSANIQLMLVQKIEFVFPTSAIIGSVNLIGCSQDSESIWSEDDCYHWQLKNQSLFKKPILGVKGKLQIWNYPLINKIKNYEKIIDPSTRV